MRGRQTRPDLLSKAKRDSMAALPTPYYLIDKAKLRHNMEIMARLRARSGAKTLLALKGFAAHALFDFMRPYMDGTTSSSLFELRLGHEKFGKESHAYSVAWGKEEIEKALVYADKIIFNSISQLRQFERQSRGCPRGLRLNPHISYSHFDLADPARPFSRLGENEAEKIEPYLDLISGFMLHYNCENDDFAAFDRQLGEIEARYGRLFAQVEWISLGGGLHFTGENYPLDKFADRLKHFAKSHDVQVYLEPGEAAVNGSATLETRVLDSFNNGKNIAILDASVEAHMLDLLIYRQPATILPNSGAHEIMLCGKSCLAGDIFGTFRFEKLLKTGDHVSLCNAAAYTMVKKNWFNGVAMPAIAVKELDGSTRLIRRFTYEDYCNSLS